MTEMSSSFKSSSFPYLNIRKTENIFFSDDEDTDFNFKYVPANEFKYVVKDVKRQRMKLDEERVWTSFVKHQEQKNSDNNHVNCFHDLTNTQQILRSNLDEIDQELKRLAEDALPEQTKGVNDYKISKFDKRQKDDLVNKRNNLISQSIIHCPIEYDESENTNVLLTIPEERFPISQLNLTSKSNKSRYEHTIKHQMERSQSLNYRECNSNLGFTSPNYSDNSNEIPEIRPHPVIAQKILGIQARISELLDEIFYRLGRILPPDGDIDLKRRQQRAMEFAVRFSRNYLYELGRQMADIERHVRVVLTNAKIKPTKRGTLLHMQALELKLCSAHQLLLNALSAYCKHIPSSILKGHPGKLKDILQIVIDIEDICSKINVTAEYFGAGDIPPPPLGKDTKKRCYSILSKLRSNSNNESPLFSRSAQSTLIGVSVHTDNKRRRNQMDSHKLFPNRFSMYSVDSRHNRYQKNRRPVSVGEYLKEKKPIIDKHTMSNPPPTPNQPHSSLVTLKSIKNPIKRGRMRARVYRKEDEIKTMMDLMSNNSGSNGLLSQKCHSSISNETKIIRKCNSKQKQCKRNSQMTTNSSRQSFNYAPDDNKSSEGVKITDKHLSNLIPVIADIMNLIANKQNNYDNEAGITSVETFLEGWHEYLITKNKKNNYQSIGTSPGVHQENSNRKFVESSITHEAIQENMLLQKEQPPFISTTHEPLIQPRQNNENKDCKLTPLIVVNESTDQLMKYRDELLNYRQTYLSSPMYISNSPNKPWEVIGWIADKLVDELIVELSKELQMDDVIRKMFDLEFQEF